MNLKTSPNILIIAGEPSGDTHGAHLMESMLKVNPQIRFWGTGGDAMIAQGLEAKYHAKEMAVTGFVEVIKRYAFIREIFKTILDACQTEKPSAAILIDYPGFNIRLGLKLKTMDIPVYYYISPQVWAWKKGRVKTLQKFVKKMFVIFPFEEDFYKDHHIPVAYYGHPLLDQSISLDKKDDFFAQHGLNDAHPIVGFLPGSRINEISRHNSVLVETVEHLVSINPNIQILVAGMKQLPQELYNNLSHHPKVHVIWDNPYPIMAYSDSIVVASGTASLEVAYFETPMIVMYKIAPISYWLARMVVSIEDIAMPNLIYGSRLIPELIQDDASPELISRWLIDLIEDKALRENMIQGLKDIKAKLGEPGATDRIAQDILS